MAQQVTRPGKLAALASTKSAVAGAVTMEKLTDYKDASTYNNFYEFGTDKADPRATRTPSRPRPGRWRWRAHQSRANTALKICSTAQRAGRAHLRLRCVEGWSMVIPWVGYSLAELIKRVEPMGSAKYVEFVTLADKATMPVGSRVLDWPMWRPAHGRSHAPAGPCWRLACMARCCPTRTRAGAPGGAMEVRFQERQEHRQDPFTERSQAPPGTRPRSRNTALFQREPNVDHPAGARRPSAALAKTDCLPKSVRR